MPRLPLDRGIRWYAMPYVPRKEGQAVLVPWEVLSHAYHVAERMHLAYGFPLMLKEVAHWLWRHRAWLQRMRAHR